MPPLFKATASCRSPKATQPGADHPEAAGRRCHAGVETLYTEPGSPWENGYAESFNRRFRDELPAREEFQNVAAARTYGTRYRLEYNHWRPYSALGYWTPAEFAAGCTVSGFATLSPQPHSRTPELNPLPVSQTMLS